MKKITTLLVALSIAAAPVAADGAKFKDINEVEWAKSYIEKVNELGIVKGYEDNEFKPNKKVTKCNALLMMYRTLKHEGTVDLSKEEKLTEKYKEVMDRNNLPTYTGLREAIAYFLEEGVVQASELEKFMVDKPGYKDKLENSINREDIGYYLGQIINKELNGKIDAEVKADLGAFKDGDKIREKYRPYISLLYKNDIISGDDKKNFNPQNSLTRAEFSKIVCESINVIEAKKKADTKTVRTEIRKVNENERKITFYFVDKDFERTRDIAEEVKISINKEKAKIDDLKPGMVADVIYYKNAIAAIRAEKPQETEKILGFVEKVDQQKRIVYYKESVKSKEVKEIEVLDVKIFLDKKESNFSSIIKGQSISAKFRNNKLITVDLISKKKIFRGIISDINKSDASIAIKNEEFSAEFTIPSDCKITKSGKNEALGNLKIGNKAVLTSEYGKIVKLETYPNTKLGVINGVFKGDGSKNKKNSIEVLFGSEEPVTYPINGDVKIYINGRAANQVFDLRVNSSVTLTFDGEDLIKIDARSYGNKISLVGYVKSIQKDDKILNVETIDNGNRGDDFAYDLIMKNAIIIDMKGRRGDMSDLKEWQKVFFYGNRERDSSEENLVKVEKLIILENADYSDEN